MRILTLMAGLCLAAACGGGGSSSAAPPNPPPAATMISDIQGAGATSPMDGQTVTVTGVVT
ncbi:MAG: hypothetical protein OES59_07795, partial [Gammaproteobacteria bacterium]|nr:hypothetical protein [Gammaproteobacteria bacterium]